MAGVRGNETALASLSPEEYLERTGIDATLRELANLLLENRPARPVQFLHEYLKGLTQPSTSLLRSYRLILQSTHLQKVFLDNLFAAYANLDAKRGGNNSGLRGSEYISLTRMICIDFPVEVVTGILRVLNKKESETVSFEEFISGMQTVVLYRDYLEEISLIFKHLDTEKQGKVRVDQLYRALGKLSARTDMRVPSVSQLEQSEAAAVVQGKTFVSYQDFLLAMFSAAA